MIISLFGIKVTFSMCLITFLSIFYLLSHYKNYMSEVGIIIIFNL